jgi:hypothetical protein
MSLRAISGWDQRAPDEAGVGWSVAVSRLPGVRLPLADRREVIWGMGIASGVPGGLTEHAQGAIGGLGVVHFHHGNSISLKKQRLMPIFVSR